MQTDKPLPMPDQPLS
jgi:glycine hydroxymethyltransferase